MVQIETLTFDQQVEAIFERGIAAVEPELRGSSRLRARPSRPSARRSFSLEVVPRRRGRGAGRAPWEAGRLRAPTPDDLEASVPIEAVELPDAPAYFAIDIDLGAGSRNVRPEDALRDILEAGRSPLTIDEGIALVLQQPEVIATNWGFSMAGSRRGDQRVPAFWISEGRPKLGWCWDRNPHTWLGTASCARRAARLPARNARRRRPSRSSRSPHSRIGSEWLEDNHERPTAVWIKVAKKASGIESVSAAPGARGLPCFGWIDSRREEPRRRPTFSSATPPRRARSNWSQINRDSVERAHRGGQDAPGGPPPRSSGRRPTAAGRPTDAQPSRSRNAAPPPSAASTVTAPPCASATWRTIARPRPDPGTARASSPR